MYSIFKHYLGARVSKYQEFKQMIGNFPLKYRDFLDKGDLAHQFKFKLW